MNTFHKIIIVFLFLLSVSASGQAVKCNGCQKEIKGEYILVDGKPYHPEHFKCANCNKPITGSYYSKNGNYYDEKCYGKLFMPKCAICGKPISGEYLIDSYGMKIHKYHEHQLTRCDNCNKIISERTTNGGVKYSDGRSVCNICYNNSLTSVQQYYKALTKVTNRLKNYNMSFNISDIKIKMVDLNILQKVSGNMYSKNIRGYTFTEIQTIGNNKNFDHTIYILSGIPSKYAESTIAHELMHIWISENLNHKLSRQLEEGSCNYISYTYLKSDYSEESKDILKQLKKSPDKIYGDGYRKVYDRFRGRDFNLFLNYLRKNKTI